MVYIKMSADYVSLEEISEITSVSVNKVEEFVNRGLQFASMIVDQYSAGSSSSDRKLRLLFDLDEIGLEDDVKRLLVMGYEGKVRDMDGYITAVKDTLHRYEVKSDVVGRVVERILQENR